MKHTNLNCFITIKLYFIYQVVFEHFNYLSLCLIRGPSYVLY